MRLRRCYTPQQLHAPARLELDPRSHHHLVNVLRMRAGDAVILFNGDGHDYHGTLLEASRRQASVEISRQSANNRECACRITLMQGLAKGERMDWVMQKATELGVHAIQPLITERSSVQLSGARLDKRLAHWQAVVISACEQSGRARVPAVLEPVSLKTLRDSANGVVLHPGDYPRLPQVVEAPNGLDLAIGPEGGFSTAEVTRLRQVGFVAASLGERILRTETAALAALALLTLGDLREGLAAG